MHRPRPVQPLGYQPPQFARPIVQQQQPAQGPDQFDGQAAMIDLAMEIYTRLATEYLESLAGEPSLQQLQALALKSQKAAAAFFSTGGQDGQS